jgi:phytanoyl-CoA hydroxylase
MSYRLCHVPCFVRGPSAFGTLYREYASVDTRARNNMLTTSEVERFERDGFLVVDDVVSPSDVEALKKASSARAIEEELLLRGSQTRGVHLFELSVRDPIFRRFAADRRIVDRLAPLIGNDIQLHHSKLAVQPPIAGAGGFEAHQDFAYLPHTNMDIVATMLMLDDASPDNGCMFAVPGSHKLGVLPCDEVTGFIDLGSLASSCPPPVPLMPRAGGMSIHHVLTVHYAPVNPSGNPRRGVVYQYRSADAHQLGDKYFPETGYQVLGEYRARVRCSEGVFSLRSDVYRGLGTSLVHFGEIARRWNEEERFARSRSWSPYR